MTGWRTIGAAVLVAIVGALQGLDWASLIPSDPKTAGWIVSGIGFVFGLLRMVTTTPVGTAPK